MKNQNILNQFIIEASLVDPITKIVNGLEAGTYRDCDIKWLDSKLEGFVKIACEALGITAIMPSTIPGEAFVLLNDHVKAIYLKRYNTLLSYFKTF